VTGVHAVDEQLQSQLLFAAVSIAARITAPGGHFCAKIFKGDCLSLLQSQLALLYERVDVLKPSSSRLRSAEHFIVGRGFKFGDELPSLLGDAAAMPADVSALCSLLARGDLGSAGE
jgi:tRNA (cytidine32/guanosine34-2'-O)-methyltransferase